MGKKTKRTGFVTFVFGESVHYKLRVRLFCTVHLFFFIFFCSSPNKMIFEKKNGTLEWSPCAFH